MPIRKSILRDTIRILSDYADDGDLTIAKNRHYKISGYRNGKFWILTLPTSPSGQYVEREVRSKIRRLERQYSRIPGDQEPPLNPTLPPYQDRCAR